MKTYRELLAYLQNMPDERLDDTATVYLTESDEFLPIQTFNKQEGDDVIPDQNHYLEIKF